MDVFCYISECGATTSARSDPRWRYPVFKVYMNDPGGLTIVDIQNLSNCLKGSEYYLNLILMENYLILF